MTSEQSRQVQEALIGFVIRASGAGATLVEVQVLPAVAHVLLCYLASDSSSFKNE